MANVLKMALIESILSLHALRYSQRQIARELGVDRETVRGKTSHCADRLGRVKTHSILSHPARRLRGLKGSHFFAPPGSGAQCQRR
jgi:DNA-binding CsgD family transcriptional regulator